ncbi:MAG: hypothetical protein ACRDQ0_02405 [Pseudonocardia sp.]
MSERTPRTVGLPLLATAASATVIAAVSMDVLADEHPSHTAALGLVAVVVAALRLRLGGRHEGVFSAVSGALVAQPALHATSKIGGTAGRGDHHEGLLHVIVTDAPTALVQVVVPAIIVVTVAFSAQLLRLLGGALRPLALVLSSPSAPRRVRIDVRTRPRGSMLRWCGWAIRAARRGPPRVVVPAHR